MTSVTKPVQAAAFDAANSRAYLRAVFAAWRAGQIVTALPAGIGDVPGLVLSARTRFEADPGWFDETLPASPPEALSQIAFSSGTTGQPKALALTHGAQWDVVERINTAMEVDATIREYVGVPVTFSFGFGRVRAVAAAGGHSFLPRHGFDPTEVAAMLRRRDINAVSAVPTLWRIVLANPDIFGAEAAHLRWIEIGSQYMSGAEKQALRRLFPQARIVQHYGLTEASRSTLLDISEAPEARLETVGRATGNVEIALSPEGVIRVRGPHLAAGRLTEQGVIPITDGDGWLTTSDRGTLEDGWLSYRGRMDELINCGGIKIDPAQFEQRLSAQLGTAEGVAIGRVQDKMRGEQVLVAIAQDHATDRAALERTARTIAEGYGLTGQGALQFREVAEIPRTATGKTQRAALADLADVSARTQPKAPDPQQTTPPKGSDRAAELQAIWAEALGLDTVPLDKGFYDLGGDSLSALTAIIRMEAMGVDPETARSIFDGRTIGDLAGLAAPSAPTPVSAPPDAPATAPAPGVGGLTLAEMVNVVHGVRGVLIAWVIIVHWLPGVLERLGDATTWIYGALTPVWRFGTPGFAMVFGLGIGALGIQRYALNRAAAIRNARFNTQLVVAGVLAMALIRAGVLWTQGDLGSWLAPSVMFYSALSYYALALLAMPVLLHVLNIGSNRLLTILMACLGAMVLHQILFASFAHLRPELGVVELVKILMTAKYGFFQMTGYALIGVAVGWLLRQHHGRGDLQKVLVLYAVLSAGLGLLMIYLDPPEVLRTSFDLPGPRHMLVYLGVLLLIMALFVPLNRAGGAQTGPLLSRLNSFAIASGILALPAFVGHELVIPLKALLEAAGLPEPVALVASVGAFVGGMVFAYFKLMRLLVR